MNVSATTPVVITPSVLGGSIERDLRSDQAQIATFETQISTGRTINLPSDGPAQASDILKLGSAVSRAKQYATNAEDGVSRLSLANSTITSVMGILQQVSSNLVGLSGEELTGSTAVTSASTVVQSARTQLIDLANTLFAGQAIFSGTGTPNRAYEPTGAYVGAGTAPTRTVAPGTQVAVSVTGPTVFGGTGSTGLLGKTGILGTIITQLTSGNAATVTKAATTGLGALQSAMTKVAGEAGKLGADQQAIQGFAAQASATVTSFEQELASAQNATMAQAITNLQALQTSYQAALYITSKLNADSLLNYL